mmetsp:Transcript_15081/g.37742  ORF Transcript_15081/g.37742 Transcript_15081/m.37742 type:complete len:307 (+) Transcript_15081:31-951(+)|eukprot:CAMPEP_0173436574 /NCGR_PEP_ID=MMETSP1357-20121228/16482_1 /TAXON_ID=77926 /ORGANISM="Hemiselmis rufescens, Strain PCC563" /LENGTH=306 /DNA_ID=CAMNT_0014401673 /DNA_START=20 /DNA_END=940 /DNA_ORIENTATION=-
MDEFAGMQGAGAIQQMNLDDVSPATRLLEKRRQMFEVQEALETQKEEFARREELFKRREEQLRKQDLELQQQLIRFNKFLQENDSKTARAEKKATEEIKLREQKEKEIQELTQHLRELTVNKDDMKAVLDKNLVYEKYLLSVLEESDDFVEINDLLKRHETLKAHHKDLQRRAAEVVALNDRYRTELQQYTKEGQDTKLKGHNEIAVLQKSLESTQLQSHVAGGSRERMLEESAERVLEFGKCGMAITNLYERCRAKSKVKQPYTTDHHEQLKVLQDFVMDLSFIVQKGRQASQKLEGMPSTAKQQ